MISLATLEERPAEICAPIRQPVAYEVEGYYPAEYCIRYHSHPLLRSYTVSLEKFELNVPCWRVFPPPHLALSDPFGNN